MHQLQKMNGRERTEGKLSCYDTVDIECILPYKKTAVTRYRKCYNVLNKSIKHHYAYQTSVRLHKTKCRLGQAFRHAMHLEVVAVVNADQFFNVAFGGGTPSNALSVLLHTPMQTPSQSADGLRRPVNCRQGGQEQHRLSGRYGRCSESESEWGTL